jgi:hypothetical protein
LALGGSYKFLRKATRFLCISFLRQASAEIPPFLPLKKGAEGRFKKTFSKS